MKNSNDEKTGGIFGTIRLIYSEIRKTNAFPVVVFDHGLSRRRLELYPQYKHADERKINRDQVLTPEEVKYDYITWYRFSRNALSELFPLIGIPVIKIAGWEGDDLMYLISKLSEESTILTDDKDLLQLLSPTVDVVRPAAGKLNLKNNTDKYIDHYTMEKFLEDSGYKHMYEFIMQKAICGDGSDNIGKSCERVAEGTAPDLIKILENTILIDKKFPKTEEELREICNSLQIKYKKAFLNFDREKYERNIGLVDLNLVDNDVDQQLIDSIVATISNCRNRIDPIAAITELHRFDIKEIYPDEIIQATYSRENNLFK